MALRLLRALGRGLELKAAASGGKMLEVPTLRAWVKARVMVLTTTGCCNALAIVSDSCVALTSLAPTYR